MFTPKNNNMIWIQTLKSKVNIRGINAQIKFATNLHNSFLRELGLPEIR